MSAASKLDQKISANLSVVESCRRLRIPVRDHVAAVLPDVADLPIHQIKERTPQRGLQRTHNPLHNSSRPLTDTLRNTLAPRQASSDMILLLSKLGGDS